MGRLGGKKSLFSGVLIAGVLGLAGFCWWNYRPAPFLATARVADSPPPLPPPYPYDSLHTGDIVLRFGKGFVSNAMRQASKREKLFSHAGILRIEGGIPYVWHLTGGEAQADNFVKYEALRDFIAPEISRRHAFYRFRLPPATLHRLDSLLARHYAQKLAFDLDFDLASDETMYCTEMIYKTMATANAGVQIFTTTWVGEKEVVAVDDLYLNEFTFFLGE